MSIFGVSNDLVQRLQDENVKLRQLVSAHARRTEAVYQYYAGEGTFEQMNELLTCNTLVYRLSEEIGIEA